MMAYPVSNNGVGSLFIHISPFALNQLKNLLPAKFTIKREVVNASWRSDAKFFAIRHTALNRYAVGESSRLKFSR